MKSIIQEASSIAKAIEQGWIKAGKPKEFNVKIYEEAEKNFLGFTTKMAKVGIFFSEQRPYGRDSRQPQQHAPQRRRFKHRRDDRRDERHDGRRDSRRDDRRDSRDEGHREKWYKPQEEHPQDGQPRRHDERQYGQRHDQRQQHQRSEEQGSEQHGQYRQQRQHEQRSYERPHEQHSPERPERTDREQHSNEPSSDKNQDSNE